MGRITALVDEVLLNVSKGPHPNAGVQLTLSGLNKPIQLRAVVLAAVVFVPRRK
jgi:hypothetical protein